MPEMRRYLDWAVAHREHFLFLVFSLFVGGIVQNKDILLIHAFFVLLLFVLIASFRLGKSAWIFALLASAIFTERIGPDKRLLLILLFSIVGLLAGAGFSRWKGRKEKSTLKTSPEQGKTEEKKPFFEKEVACRFCGRLISKAELECPHCKKKQYDLSEINTLLEKKGKDPGGS